MEPYRILASHVPMRQPSRWARLLGRRPCRTCGHHWPCAQQRAALDDLAPPRPPYTSQYAWSATPTIPISTVGQPLTVGQASLYGQAAER
jgi:hypothetical protein